MKIIVPMAGAGKRMRPHTLTTPKPMVPIAGKPIVQRLVEDITAICKQDVEEIAFIIGPTYKESDKADLLQVAADLGAKGRICFQDEALGTAHAILCAQEALEGNVIVAFADTLFKADFTLDTNTDGTIWVKQIEDPSQFGVVKLDSNNIITDFVEKPETFVSDLAIIGIYYFKDGANLKQELQYLIDNNITDKGEYQLTNALENMKSKGKKFTTGTVDAWMDCGNKNVTVNTNKQVLGFIADQKLVSDKATIINSTIIAPCYIADNVVIENSVVGPHVSVGEGTKIIGSVIENAIVRNETLIEKKVISNSLIGNNVILTGKPEELSIGDFSTSL